MVCQIVRRALWSNGDLAVTYDRHCDGGRARSGGRWKGSVFVSVGVIVLERGQNKEIRTVSTRVSSVCCAVDVSGIITRMQTESACCTDTPPTSGVPTGGVQTPPPEIPKARQNCAKLNPICENC